MPTPTFDIRIDKSGKLTVRVSGVSGEECLKLSDMIAQIVGREESRELTPEYHAGGNVRVNAAGHVQGRVTR